MIVEYRGQHGTQPADSAWRLTKWLWNLTAQTSGIAFSEMPDRQTAVDFPNNHSKPPRLGVMGGRSHTGVV